MAHRDDQNWLSQSAIARIKFLRESQGISSYELARRLGSMGVTITAQAITLQERGRTKAVTVDYVFAAAKVLGVSAELLVGLEECERCHDAPPVGFMCPMCGCEGV